MPLVLIPLAVVVLNDFIKCLVQSYKLKKFELKWMFHSGGMPSGHSALAGSVMTVAFLEAGSSSVEFMISAIFGILLMYDARGIRAEAGKHAKVLNQIQNNVILDEYLGHTPLQVIAGAFFGVIVAYLLWRTGLFIEIK